MAHLVTTDAGNLDGDINTESTFTSYGHNDTKQGISSTPSSYFPSSYAENNDNNMSDLTRAEIHKSQNNCSVFQAFIIVEIIMTTLELLIWIAAAIKISKWKKNYRNQMLLQLSVVRFFKRIVFLIVFLKDIEVIQQTNQLKTALLSLQIYIDFVIVILVFFLIKHMYDSLIVVMVKVSEFNLYKVLLIGWLLPIPISAVWTVILTMDALEYWSVYLLICCLFRWPVMLLGTILYLTVLCRVLNDKIRKFARSLTIITFLLCLIINFYLFSKDVIELFCLTNFATMLVSYISGFLLNLIVLSFYIILIMLNYRSSNARSFDSIPNNSISIDK